MTITDIIGHSKFHLLFTENEVAEIENIINFDTMELRCLIRDKLIKVTPEEIIRQLFINRLLNQYGYKKNQIYLEYKIFIGSAKKFADIVILNNENKISIIVEVKKTNSNSGKEQLFSYCFATGSKYGIWLNGVEIEQYSFIGNNYKVIKDIPHYANIQLDNIKTPSQSEIILFILKNWKIVAISFAVIILGLLIFNTDFNNYKKIQSDSLQHKPQNLPLLSLNGTESITSNAYPNDNTELFVDSLLKAKDYHNLEYFLDTFMLRTHQDSLNWNLKYQNLKNGLPLLKQTGYDMVVLDFSVNLVLTMQDSLIGFFDKNGNELFKPIFSGMSYGSFENLIVVESNNKFGFLNEYGKMVADTIYDNIDNFHQNLIITKRNNKYGFLDYKGNLISNPIYQEINPNDSYYIIVKYKNKYGVMDINGKIVIPIKYDTIGNFENNKAYACLKDEKFYIDIYGKKVSNPVFDN